MAVAWIADERFADTAVSAPQTGVPRAEGMRLLGRVGVVDPESLDDYRAAGGYAALRRAVEAFEAATRGVRSAAIALFAHVFVVSPLVALVLGLSLAWPLVALGLLVLVPFAAVRFRTAHRTLYPEEAGARRRGLLLVVLTPLTAIRGYVEALLDDYSAVTVAERLGVSRQKVYEIGRATPLVPCIDQIGGSHVGGSNA